MTLFAWPAAARFGQRVPRERLFVRAGGGKVIRSLYAEQVERIVWAWKLYPGSVGLPPGGVSEIEVLTIDLRSDALDLRVLAHIDKAVPQRTMFELKRGNEACTAAAFKRAGDRSAMARDKEMVAGEHAVGPWTSGDRRELVPVAVSLKGLYAGLLRAVWERPMREGETLRAQAERLAELARRERQIATLEARMRRESVFARKVVLNQELRKMRTARDVLM